MDNHFELSFSALSQNESFARVAIAAFVVQLSPTLGEMADIKTAVSEAVTNAIVHGYRNTPPEADPQVLLTATLHYRRLTVTIHDDGCGIEDIPTAMKPFFSTGNEAERSGMGFCVMQTFMDSVDVKSTVGVGTTVTLQKQIALPHCAMPAAAVHG